jgi:hypothetical protein
MAETVNIGEMAEKISREIFSELKWEILPATNTNWKCVNPSHEKTTHPSDVVFTYLDPYRNSRTYINCDLKSYSKESISKGAVHTAIKNLALSISCADLSEEWHKTFKHHRDNFQIVGLLFIYNHDGEYDKDFQTLLHNALSDDIPLDENKKIVVLGPREICNLATIVNDIKVLRGDEKISNKQDCSFYFPDLIGRKLQRASESLAATVEMITSSFIVLRYRIPGSTIESGLKIYYKRPGSSIEEFIYLFDYLFHFQIIENDSIREVEFRLLQPDQHASTLFETAKTEYAIRFQNDTKFSARFQKVKYSSVLNIVTKYSSIEIGMRYE